MTGELFALEGFTVAADLVRELVDPPAISFTVPGEPKSKGRPRAVVRRRGAQVWADAYTPRETIEAEKLFAARCLEFAPGTPLQGPLAVDLGFVFGIPGSWPRWKVEAAARGVFHHVGSKDLDNLVKLAFDAMNGVFFLDDRQIVDLHATKGYGAIPRTRVTISQLRQAERGER